MNSLLPNRKHQASMVLSDVLPFHSHCVQETVLYPLIEYQYTVQRSIKFQFQSSSKRLTVELRQHNTPCVHDGWMHHLSYTTSLKPQGVSLRLIAISTTTKVIPHTISQCVYSVCNFEVRMF